MSYVVFALKWRPRNFGEIVGQSHIVNILENAIGKDRLGHAYLFAGPRGVGKTSTARILAKALNCKNGPTLNPCQKCASCIEISQARSLDVLEIDGASNRGIEEIRTLRENIKFAPTQGRYKVYIIDEVHQITPDGFNALLKTLEEPPEFVKFIFATTQPDKIIPTILSRCQRLDFRRISVIEIIQQLEKIAALEKIAVDKEVLTAIARASDGALRDAETVLDQLFSFTKDKISLSDVTSMLGLVEQETLFEITDKIIQKDGREALVLLDQVLYQGKDPTVFLMHLIGHFRNLMIAKVAQADSQLIDLPAEVCKRLLEQSRLFTLEEIFNAFNILVNTQEVAKRLDSLRIPLEIGLVKLAHNKKELNSDPGQGKSQRAPKAADNEQHQDNPDKTECAPSNESAATPQAAAADISFEALKVAWPDIIQGLGKTKMSVATYLNEGLPTRLQGSVLTVTFPINCSLHKEALERKENRCIIEKALSDSLNTSLRVHFILSKEMPHNEECESDSFLKNVLQTFRGRVIREE